MSLAEKRFIAVLYGLVTLFLVQRSRADVFDVNTSVRAVGMGGAFVAVVDDSNSLFYNPAGLSRAGGVYWTIIDPAIGLSNVDALQTLSDLQSDSGFASALSGIYGEPFWIGGGAKTAIVLPFFGVAYYDNLNLQLELTNPVYPNLHLVGYNDIGLALGFAFPIIPGFLYGGMNIRRVQRTGTDQNITGGVISNLDPDLITNDLENKALGYGMDIGMNFVIPTPFVHPIFSAVWKNVGGTSFVSDTGTNPPSDEGDMTLGAALEVDLPIISITPALELRKLNQADEQLGKKIHLGLEIGLPLIDLRAGFYQGYYTLGVGLGLGPLDINVATYGVELGEYPGQLEDRRYVLQIGIEIGLPTGGLSIFNDDSAGPGGRSPKSSARYRKLKQRR